jgi:7-cyano-7-deazaguanine reductase
MKDLSKAAGADVKVDIHLLHQTSEKIQRQFDGICLDDLDITCENYHVDPTLLTVEEHITSETLYSDLLKSNCLITGQPDWGSLQISYTGKKIQHENLLKYIISFRDHNEFHEHCVERIFMDIMQYCKPEKLTVYAKYVRRGGLDINPIRSTEMRFEDNQLRLCRQ